MLLGSLGEIGSRYWALDWFWVVEPSEVESG